MAEPNGCRGLLAGFFAAVCVAAAAVDELAVAEVDFAVQRAGTCALDIPVSLDLSRAEGVEFDFSCADFAPFQQFNLYLKSGGGWYALTMLPEERAGVQRMVVRKRDVKWKEGRVAGWHAITAARILAYRGNPMKARFAAGNFAPFNLLQPKPGERRFIWCHSPWGMGWKDADWDESARIIRKVGFTDVVASLTWANGAFYKSAVLPPAPEFAYRKEDAFDRCRAACATNGLKMHAWMVCFNMSSHCSKKDRDAIVDAGRAQVDAKGRVNPSWLCPSHPSNARQIVDALVELARKGVDGVHLDYIRYPDGDFCHCARCTAAAEVYPSWDAFRCAMISRVVESAHKAVKSACPNVEVSAAVRGSTGGSAVRDVGQDWTAWCRAGWLDFVCPMDYGPMAASFRERIVRQKDEIGDVALYPGIGDINLWPDPSRDVSRIVGNIKIVREAGLGGFCFFDFNRRSVAAFQEICP